MAGDAVGAGPVDAGRYSALRRMVTAGDRRFVVAYGGGAVPGLAGNIALAFLLEQLDLRQHVDEVWGTSAGAITAGGWSSGTPALQLLEHVKSLDRRGAIDVAWWQLAAALFLRPFGRQLPDGILRGRHFRRTIAESLSASRFEDCDIPVRLIAVHDDGSMRRKVFRTGELLPAILASMAIPGVLIPEPVAAAGGATFFDGGLLEKTPLLSPVAEHGRRGGGPLLLLGTHFDNAANVGAARGFLARFLQTIYALEDVAWGYQLREIRAREDVTLLLLNPHLDDGALFDFGNVDENFARAHAAYAEQLSNARLPLTLGAE